MNKLLRGLLVAGSLAVLGCGSGSGPTAHLSGAVTIGGKPIPPDAEAAISFSSVDNEQAEVAKAQIVDGKYDCPDAPEGKVFVRFYITQSYGPERVSERTGKAYRETRNLVPPDYLTGIPLEVSGDNSGQDFDLAIKQRRR